jgi:hypothetical protein
MRKQILFVIIPIVLVLTVLLTGGRSLAQGPDGGGPQASVGQGFTYQGQLKDGSGNPISNTCDFRFSLWDALSGGSQVGGNCTVTGVQVANGYFAAQVDAIGEFGGNAFTGDARWLEIAVQCTGDAGYTTLSPRQELTAAPYALSLRPGALIQGVEGIAVINNDTGGTFLNPNTAVYGRATDPGGEAYGVWGVSESTAGTGVYGLANATAGTTYGVVGQSYSPTGAGVYGSATAASGLTVGVYGEALADAGVGVSGKGGLFGVSGLVETTIGVGVAGTATATSGETYGVAGTSVSTEGIGVRGYASAASGKTYGVQGVTDSSGNGHGVMGLATATSGNTLGVFGQSWSTSGNGVRGYASATSGTNYGVYGRSDSTDGTGVYGVATAASGINYGVYGSSTSGAGVYGVGANGVVGRSSTPGYEAVYGRNDASGGIGVYGRSDSTTGIGMYATAPYTGVVGIATSVDGKGVYGRAEGAGVYGAAVWGESWGGGTGVQGRSDDGVAVRGTSQFGVALESYLFIGADTSTNLLLRTWPGNGDLIKAQYETAGHDVKFRVTNAGDVYADGGYYSPAPGFAEMLPGAAGLEAGDVLVVGPDGSLARCSAAYQPTVVGVYAPQAGFLGGAGEGQDTGGKVPLAVVGVVLVKASAENGPIVPGDLLVAAATPGHAMKAGTNPPLGTVIGKALGRLDKDTSTLLMLVMLR